MRELFGLNETDNIKQVTTRKVESSNRHPPRNGLKQRRTKETSTTTPNKIHKHGVDTRNSSTSQEPLITYETQPTATTSTLDGEEIEEFFSVTNAAIKDVKKPKNTVLETFDPLNS